VQVEGEKKLRKKQINKQQRKKGHNHSLSKTTTLCLTAECDVLSFEAAGLSVICLLL
jgi:hypothetical protein